MQTRDFIFNHIPRLGPLGDNGKSSQCSSVGYWGGVLYSYGSHYPLMFKVNDVLFINTSGYSNTTAKHINWAWSAAYRYGKKAHAVHLSGTSCHGAVSFESSNGIHPDYIQKSLKDEYLAIARKFYALRRNATRMEETLVSRALDIVEALNDAFEDYKYGNKATLDEKAMKLNLLLTAVDSVPGREMVAA